MDGRLLPLLMLVVFALAQGEKKRYDGYKVLDITPKTKEHVDYLRGLTADHELDFWTERIAIDEAVQVMVPPGSMDSLSQDLLSMGVGLTVVRENVQERLDEEESRRSAIPEQRSYNFFDYNPLELIKQQLYDWIPACPAGHECEVLSIGQSYDSRQQLVFKLSKPSVLPRQAIWLDSMIHAREWLAGATLMKVANRLITQTDFFPAAAELIDKYDFYFMPNVNPDGYEYSWTTDRFWRKSRNFNPSSPTCWGTDLNRNFEYKWSREGISYSDAKYLTINGGTSDDPCSNLYLGAFPASAPETYNLQQEGLRLSSKLLAWISMHTYGQYWLTAFGYETETGNNTECAYPTQYVDIERAASAAARATEGRYGTTWLAGDTCEVLYTASGITPDFANYAGVKYSFTPELRGPGFDPPASEIEPSFLEYWDGLEALINEIELIEA